MTRWRPRRPFRVSLHRFGWAEAGLQGRADHARQDRGSSLGTLPPFAAETVKALCRRHPGLPGDDDVDGSGVRSVQLLHEGQMQLSRLRKSSLQQFELELPG